MQRGEITNGDHVRLLPDPALFHPSMFNGVFTVVTAVPVLLNAFMCHYQILPLERSLQRQLSLHALQRPHEADFGLSLKC